MENQYSPYRRAGLRCSSESAGAQWETGSISTGPREPSPARKAGRGPAGRGGRLAGGPAHTPPPRQEQAGGRHHAWHWRGRPRTRGVDSHERAKALPGGRDGITATRDEMALKKNHFEQKKGNHRRMYGLWYLCKIQKSLNDRVYCLEVTRVQQAYF